MEPTERRAHVSQEASQWWVRLRDENLPLAEREQFVDWLRESPMHVAEILRVARVHGILEGFAHWSRIDTDLSAEVTNVVSLGAEAATTDREDAAGVSVRRRSKVGLIALAAAVCAVTVAVGWVLLDLAARTIETERGERREVALADGSVLLVSPESKLRVRFDESERHISLLSGSTLFRVAKDARRPFVVQAEDTLVRAVGTAFGIEHRRGRIVVTVSEGKVEVKSEDAPKQFSPARAAVESITLLAGEQIAVPGGRAAGNGSNGAAARIDAGNVRKVDAARALAWAAGRLVFEGEPISEVVAEFNRYNRVQLHVGNETLGKRPVSGVFDASDPESFAAFVESVAAVRIERDEERNITLESP